MAQWSSFQESKGQLQQWMESVEQEVGMALPQQPGLKEKASLLERLRAILADVEGHSAALSRLTGKAAELHQKTGDQAFGPELRAELSAHFADITAVVKVIRLALAPFVETAFSSSLTMIVFRNRGVLVVSFPSNLF